MITLHQFAASPFCDKIRRVLRYKKVPFEIHEWPLTEIGGIADKNPAGKLPILDLEGRSLADSTAIALELEKKSRRRRSCRPTPRREHARSPSKTGPTSPSTSTR